MRNEDIKINDGECTENQNNSCKTYLEGVHWNHENKCKKNQM